MNTFITNLIRLERKSSQIKKEASTTIYGEILVLSHSKTFIQMATKGATNKAYANSKLIEMTIHKMKSMNKIS